MILQPDSSAVDALIRLALAEDIGKGDATCEQLIPAEAQASVVFNARTPLISCGAGLMPRVFDRVGVGVKCSQLAIDGTRLEPGQLLLMAKGPARVLLTAERTALNILQRLCGVATLTAQYAAAIEGTNCTLLDTRKTIPGWRELDKYAVRAGGGTNHRMRLDDAIMIKDNHIAIAGGIRAAVEKARSSSSLPVIVECDTLKQVSEALTAKPDRILLDNMSASQLRQAVEIAQNRVPLEASGGVTLQTVGSIADTGVNYVSVGALTHSAIAADIGADIEIE